MTTNVQAQQIEISSVITIVAGSALFGIATTLCVLAWMLEPIIAATLAPSWHLHDAEQSVIDAAGEARTGRVVLVVYLITLLMAISGATIAAIQVRSIMRDWIAGFWERLIGGSVIVTGVAVVPMLVGCTLILGTGWLVLGAYGTRVVTSDFAAFQRTADLVNKPFVRANDIRDCTVLRQSIEAFQPETSIGAVMKSGLWRSMYMPQWSDEETIVAEPCIATIEELRLLIDQLRPIVHRESRTYRRIPMLSVIPELHEAALTEDECYLDQLHNGASVQHAMEACPRISADANS